MATRLKSCRIETVRVEYAAEELAAAVRFPGHEVVALDVRPEGVCRSEFWVGPWPGIGVWADRQRAGIVS